MHFHMHLAASSNPFDVLTDKTTERFLRPTALLFVYIGPFEHTRFGLVNINAPIAPDTHIV